LQPKAPGHQFMIKAEYHNFAIELAHASGAFIRPYFCNPELVVELKSDLTIVTAADRGAEKVMRKMIAQRYPGHGVVGEELGAENAGAEYVWMLDPIDGTVSFAAGVPLFGTLIALCHRGKPILGVIHLPISGELMVGDGSVTTLNGNAVHTRKVTKPDDALLLCTDIKNVELHQNAGAFHALVRRTKTPRGWGDCYGYLLLATGRADIMCDPVLKPWDIAALIPVVQGAGGVITCWQGKDPLNAKSIVATSTPELHATVIEALNP
jgi:histidinol phosphatase-like enzyme (inositol monophosphatase family)